MEKDILSEVIEVEKEIQRCLEIEKTKANDWLVKVKQVSQEELVREEKNVKESLRIAIEQAKKDAASKAEDIVKHAETQAGRLAKLDNEALQDIIGEQIIRILPE